MPDCAQCQQEEISRACACWALEQAAADRGEPYNCQCPSSPECVHAAGNLQQLACQVE